jgi:hypothetical protein
MHYVSISKINFYIVINIKKPQHKEFLVVSNIFFERATFWIPICLCVHISGSSSYFSFKITSFIHASIVLLLLIIIFSSAKDYSIDDFHKTMS